MVSELNAFYLITCYSYIAGGDYIGPRERIPLDQRKTTRFPVLHMGDVPDISKESWELQIEGLVENSVSLTFEGFLNIPQTIDTSDFHCVTGWSRLDNKWEEVTFMTIVELVKPTSNAKFVTIESYGGYSTSLPHGMLMDTDMLFAYKHDDKEL